MVISVPWFVYGFCCPILERQVWIAASQQIYATSAQDGVELLAGVCVASVVTGGSGERPKRGQSGIFPAGVKASKQKIEIAVTVSFLQRFQGACHYHLGSAVRSRMDERNFPKITRPILRSLLLFTYAHLVLFSSAILILMLYFLIFSIESYLSR